MSKRIFTLCLALIMIFMGSFAVNAATVDNTVQPYYNYTSNLGVALSISSGKAYCESQVIGYSGVTKIKITLDLQRRGVLFWNQVDTWTATYYDEYAYMSKSTSVSSGKYRVKATVVVYKGSDSETITGYSPEKEY